eukprot:gene4246-biopygen5329
MWAPERVRHMLPAEGPAVRLEHAVVVALRLQHAGELVPRVEGARVLPAEGADLRLEHRAEFRLRTVVVALRLQNDGEVVPRGEGARVLPGTCTRKSVRPTELMHSCDCIDWTDDTAYSDGQNHSVQPT